MVAVLGDGSSLRRVGTHPELIAALDEVVPTLAERGTPLPLDVTVAAERSPTSPATLPEE